MHWNRAINLRTTTVAVAAVRFQTDSTGPMLKCSKISL